MSMIPTPTGYRLVPPSIDYRGVLAPMSFGCFLKPRPAHRAVTDVAHLALNRHGLAYFQVTGLLADRVTSGCHINRVQSPAALDAEEAARVREYRTVVNLLRRVPGGVIRDV